MMIDGDGGDDDDLSIVKAMEFFSLPFLCCLRPQKSSGLLGTMDRALLALKGLLMMIKIVELRS